MDNAVVFLRNKFAEDLEEILQCPVCYERLTDTVLVCQQGHHLCVNCKRQIEECPFCKSYFVGTRNYLAENIILKFEEIKTSLLNPSHSLNRKIKSNVCVETQTDLDILNTNVSLSESELLNNKFSKFSLSDSNTFPIVGKGKYPCKLAGCDKELPHGRMIPHLRYFHANKLVEEKLINADFYENSWKLDYLSLKVFDKAINMPYMGLFFLQISADEAGDLYSIVCIVNTSLVAQQFQYTLHLYSTHYSTSYQGKVVSCRTTKEKKNLLTNQEFIENLVDRNNYLTCKLTINRLK